MAIHFPEIDPVIISIGPLAIRWYALAYIAGRLGGWHYIKRLNQHSPIALPVKTYDSIVTWSILGIILGGRLGYVLFYNPTYFLHHPQEIIMVWHGGMAFHGGLLGMIAAIWLLARRDNIPFFTLMDNIACAAPIGLFFGRIANFINAELYGRPTDMPWGVIFPYSDGLARHPSQLYEAALEGLLLFIILRILVTRHRMLHHAGMASGEFLVGYGVSRFVVEFFREPDAHIGFLWYGATMGQFLSLPMIVVGVLLLIRSKRTA